MIRALMVAGLLALLSGCALAALPALQMGAAAVGIAAGGTTIVAKGPEAWANIQAAWDRRALELPPQP